MINVLQFADIVAAHREPQRLEQRIDAAIMAVGKTGEFDDIEVSVTGWSRSAVDAMIAKYGEFGWSVAYSPGHLGMPFYDVLVLTRAP